MKYNKCYTYVNGSYNDENHIRGKIEISPDVKTELWDGFSKEFSKNFPKEKDPDMFLAEIETGIDRKLNALQSEKFSDAVAKALEPFSDQIDELASLVAYKRYLILDEEHKKASTHNQIVRKDKYENDKISCMITRSNYTYDLTFDVDNYGDYCSVRYWLRCGGLIKNTEKRFKNRDEVQPYIDGRIKAYEKYFTEEYPAVPEVYSSYFSVGGKLLPGVTVIDN